MRGHQIDIFVVPLEEKILSLRLLSLCFVSIVPTFANVVQLFLVQKKIKATWVFFKMQSDTQLFSRYSLS